MVATMLLTLCAAAPSTAPNMNGEYVISRTPRANASIPFSANYSQYPGGTEYFDVYSPPITTLYSQVFWTRLPTVPIPEEIVTRFAGKDMAVVGYEIDQVRRTPEGDVSVPINLAYNHHFESTLLGKNARLEKIHLTGPDDPRRPKGHGCAGMRADGVAWVVKDLKPDSPTPNSQDFGAANGGEYRKSFHGYAPGWAQIVHSPESLSVEPMQIDTWNRDKMPLEGGAFVPGPVPRNSLAPTEGPDAIYSGLLECPVTTRIRKVIDGTYTAQLDGTCADKILTASECFAAASTIGFPSGSKFVTEEGSTTTLPTGCSATALGNGTVHVFFNTEGGGAECGDSGKVTVTAGSTVSLVTVSVHLDATADVATITLAGPSDVWFGVGFNASSMADEPYTIVVDGEGNVTERRLANHLAGDQLSDSVNVTNSSVTGGIRTVVLTRGLTGATTQHFTFSVVEDTTLNFINAVGSGPALAYHKDKTGAVLSLLPVGAPTCVCASTPAPFGQAKGSLHYGNTSVGFANNCAPQPRTDLLAQHNPTCDIRTYSGGQTACHHMWSLLDEDQEIPWSDQPITYHHKFRFHFQEYNASYHKDLSHAAWGIASPVEYDVPQCPPGTKVEDCVHTITGLLTPAPAGGNLRLAAAHFHCHAPTCLSMELWNNATGELLCREEPYYGGTGHEKEERFNERGFITVPPCLWGSEEDGFEAPPLLSGVPLYAIKRANNTYGHHGEMAWMQMYFTTD